MILKNEWACFVGLKPFVKWLQHLEWTFVKKDFLQIDWRVCTSPGPHTWSPGTGPVLPSLPSPGTLRQLARPTCTVASFLSCTRSHPSMCGQRTLTCEWTLPWKWVGGWAQGLVQLLSNSYWFKLLSPLWLFTSPPCSQLLPLIVHKGDKGLNAAFTKPFWFHFQARSEASSRKGTLSSSWPAGVQALATPTPCVWFWWLEQPKGLLTLSIFISSFTGLHSRPLKLSVLTQTYSQLTEQ